MGYLTSLTFSRRLLRILHACRFGRGMMSSSRPQPVAPRLSEQELGASGDKGIALKFQLLFYIDKDHVSCNSRLKMNSIRTGK